MTEGNKDDDQEREVFEMGIVMGVMIIIMVVGFLGFGHHHDMMGGHGKEEQKRGSTIQNHGKEIPCPDCPQGPGAEKGNASADDEPKMNEQNEHSLD